MPSNDSFRSWLHDQIAHVLARKGPEPPLLVWYDPERTWRELLLDVAAGKFEVWADEGHELLVRQRFQATPRAPRVVWLPVAREEATYFKVFELQAAEVRQMTLPEALTAYGVDLPSDRWSELEPILAAHAREWLDRPRPAWKELTPNTAKETLIDDQRLLEILATPGLTFEGLRAEGRLPVFTRRVVEDFGLPAPRENDPDGWRVHAVASLLCTEASARAPETPPSEPDRTIPPGPVRVRALKLLGQWQKQIDLIDAFEALADQADGLTTLSYWARTLKAIPAPLSSPAAEAILFQAEVDRLAGLDTFEALARHFDARLTTYQAHSRAFWGHRARQKVRWTHLAELASVAAVLDQHAGVQDGWTSPKDAVAWFTQAGWQVDRAGEALFREDHDLPGGLIGVRSRLRKTYQRHLDGVNAAFSELLAPAGPDVLALPFAGDAIKEVVAKASGNQPVAVLVLDACRFDLGCRLAESLNQGEPARRAEVSAALAPIPSITALGMPFCLPGLADKIRVELSARPGTAWRVTAEGVSGDLTQAGQRRDWLRKSFKLKDKGVMTVTELFAAQGPDGINIKEMGRLAFVFGDELDTGGHDDQLEITGADDHLERYARAVRLLLKAGYTTVAVVTDHGFFHWDPAEDEVIPKPEGTVLWASRRAVAGQNLKHPTALALKATAGDCECLVPRSVNAFKTYGGLGYFHGGATLQELVTPVVVARWPKKAHKIGVVLKPLGPIVRLNPTVEVAPAAVQRDLMGGVDETLTGRQVRVKIVHPASGKVIFRCREAVPIEPGGPDRAVALEKVSGAEAKLNAQLQVVVADADDEEVLDQGTATLKVELDEWS
jgi:hypothetical protein